MWAEMLHLQNLQRKRISLCSSLHFQTHTHTHTHTHASTWSQKQRRIEPERERSYSSKAHTTHTPGLRLRMLTCKSLKEALVVSLCCCYSIPQSCPTLCNPMDCSSPGLPVFTISQSVLKLTSIEALFHCTCSWKQRP